jgi:hypothetical protein
MKGAEATHVASTGDGAAGDDRSEIENAEGVSSLGFSVLHTHQGSFLVESNDGYVGMKLKSTGWYEKPALVLLLSLLQAGDLVLDVGANIGAFTIPFAKAVGRYI